MSKSVIKFEDIEYDQYSNNPNYLEFLHSTTSKLNELFNEKVSHFLWVLGNEILNIQAKYAWGSSFIRYLANDLQKLFNDNYLYTFSNLTTIREFSHLYREGVMNDPISKLPWGHIKLLINNVKDKEQRLKFVNYVIKHNASLNQLNKMINEKAYDVENMETEKYFSSFSQNTQRS
jgi:hypothetical protein